ncbi:MAG: SCP2 sterol-binding domain-containing protein [bacterium]
MTGGSNILDIPSDATPKWFFEERLPVKLPEAFEKFKDTIGGTEGILQFDVGGEGGGKWYLTIKEGTATVTEGENEDASTTFTIDAADWMAIIRKEMDPQMAFMSGKLMIAGDMTLAMKLGQIIRGLLSTEEQ